MANETVFKTRLRLKYDEWNNWKEQNPQLLKGEVAVVYLPENSNEATSEPAILFKVGDGVKTFNELPWSSALAADVHSWAKKEKGEAADILYKTESINVDGETVESAIYVNTAIADLQAQIDAITGTEGGGSSITQVIQNYISTNLNYEDTEVEGQYVSAVSEVNGVISVIRKDLPVYDEEGAAEAVLGTEEDEAGTATVHGALKSAQAAQDAADELADFVGELPENATSTTVVGYIDEAIEANVYDDAEVRQLITDNADAISVLNGNSAVEGSVDKKVADAINTFATQISDDEIVNTYKELIDYAATHGSEFTELVGVVDNNTKAIETLNGDATTAGSVDKKIANAIAAENLAQYATDEELTALSGRVGVNEANITEIIKEDGLIATAKAEAISAAEEYVNGEIEKLDSEVEASAVEGETGEINVLTGVTQANGALTGIKEAKLAKVATTGNIADLIQGEEDVLILWGGDASGWTE